MNPIINEDTQINKMQSSFYTPLSKIFGYSLPQEWKWKQICCWLCQVRQCIHLMHTPQGFSLNKIRTLSGGFWTLCLTVVMCYPLKLCTLAFLTQKRIQHNDTASLTDFYLLSCKPLSQDIISSWKWFLSIKNFFWDQRK